VKTNQILFRYQYLSHLTFHTTLVRQIYLAIKKITFLPNKFGKPFKTLSEIHQNTAKQQNQHNQNHCHFNGIAHMANKYLDILLHVGVFGVDFSFHFFAVKNVLCAKFDLVLNQLFVGFQYLDPKINIQENHRNKKPDDEKNEDAEHCFSIYFKSTKLKRIVEERSINYRLSWHRSSSFDENFYF